MPLAHVPDPVFASAMLGPGCAIHPEAENVTISAPCAGTLAKATPHGYVVVSESGVKILVHLGLDTVDLDGAGFAQRVVQGQSVGLGQQICEWDVSFARERGLSLCTPVIALADDGRGEVALLARRERIEAGEPLFRVR